MTGVVMFQGTGSGVGKSLLAAGACRWLSNQGFRVRPFKAQNMALNSGVTPDGREIGRAQVLQAEACRVPPEVRMNPILLKPQGPGVSQLIRLGEAVGVCSARDYYRLSQENFQVVQQAFRSLSSEADWVVLEGAGSPAEINLQATDIVNMRMAEDAQARVIIVGDIDRGGVFAWMKGTYDLVQPRHRALIAGFLINKFRGDLTLLQPGIQMFEELVPVPVLGVLPWREFALEDEDSQNLRSRIIPQARRQVVVIRTPYLSNFTDFDALKQVPELSVRFSRNPDDLAEADLIVLPGSKNTALDLKFLHASGMAAELLRLQGTRWICGICGGFQMLGEALDDPEGLESEGTHSGLGLLPVRTRLVPHKTLIRQHYHGLGWLGGHDWEAYEIHHGRTEWITGETTAEAFVQESADLGLIDRSRQVLGTYLHGFFDTPAVLERVLALIDPEPFDLPPALTTLRDQELDELAGFLEQHLDLPRLLGMRSGVVQTRDQSSERNIQ